MAIHTAVGPQRAKQVNLHRGAATSGVNGIADIEALMPDITTADLLFALLLCYADSVLHRLCACHSTA